MSLLQIKDISLFYKKTCAVESFSAEIGKGEMVAILGPSGCGKSSLLSCIAGMQKPKCGEIWMNDACLFSAKRQIMIPPEKRNIGFVFQNYALWPHMTVMQNIAYPLKIRKVKKELIHERVMRYLSLLHLEGYGCRYPGELSGGEQQRVALGRALIMEPELLVMDEPLSNLDAKLREQMQLEIRRIQQKLHLTILHVTHDQTEAMSMSNRILIMNKGRLMQEGEPEYLYENPDSLFTADFFGTNNILSVKDTEGGDMPRFLAIRPEDITIHRKPPKGYPYQGEAIVLDRIFMGFHIQYLLGVDNRTIKVRLDKKENFPIGAKVWYSCTRVRFLHAREDMHV